MYHQPILFASISFIIRFAFDMAWPRWCVQQPRGITNQKDWTVCDNFRYCSVSVSYSFEYLSVQVVTWAQILSLRIGFCIGFCFFFYGTSRLVLHTFSLSFWRARQWIALLNLVSARFLSFMHGGSWQSIVIGLNSYRRTNEALSLEFGHNYIWKRLS